MVFKAGQRVQWIAPGPDKGKNGTVQTVGPDTMLVEWDDRGALLHDTDTDQIVAFMWEPATLRPDAHIGYLDLTEFAEPINPLPIRFAPLRTLRDAAQVRARIVAALTAEIGDEATAERLAGVVVRALEGEREG